MAGPVPITSGGNSGSTSATLTVTLPAGLVTGQRINLYVQSGVGSGTTLTSVTGGSGAAWTTLYDTANGTTLRVLGFTRLITGSSDSSATITVTLGAAGRWAAAYDIWAPGTVIDVTSTPQANASSLTESFPAVTPSAGGADYTILGIVHLRGTATSSVATTSLPGAGYTELVDVSTAIAAISQQSIETKYQSLTGGGGSTVSPVNGTASLASTQVAVTMALRGATSATINIHYAELDLANPTRVNIHYAKFQMLASATARMNIHYARLALSPGGGVAHVNVHYANLVLGTQKTVRVHYGQITMGSSKRVNIHYAALFLQFTPRVNLHWAGFQTVAAPLSTLYSLKGGSWQPATTFELKGGVWI